MKVSPHFLRLYYKTVRRYKKLSKRLKNQLSTGQFQHKSEYAQREFLFELKKLYQRLKGLKTQVRLATAAGVTALLLSSGSISAQQNNMGPFTLQQNENPLPPPPELGTNISQTAADIDGDGDVDLLVGQYDQLNFYRNNGTTTAPNFELQTEGHPFDTLLQDGDVEIAPAFGDLNEDGVIDLLIGTRDGNLRYFINTGDVNDPVFELITAPWDPDAHTGNPLSFIDLPSSLTPVIVDFDSDGDADVLVGSDYDTYNYYTSLHLYLQNDDGSFSRDDLYYSGADQDDVAPTVIDIDNDGDYDVLTGEKYGSINFYKNNGIIDGTWDFTQEFGEGNPFNEINAGFSSVPLLVDLNNDSFYDLLIGRKYGTPDILYYENNQDNTFTQITGLNSPFGGVMVNGMAAPTLADIDEDGLMDIVIGSAGYTDGQAVKYFRNTGSGFVEMTADENPFDTLNVSDFSPQFVDINGDGHIDIVGADYDQIRYFENDGEGGYVENETLFSDISFNWNGFQSSQFVDIDNDGDQDLFFTDYLYYGEDYGIRFFENTGASPSTPFFVEVTGVDNPFSELLEDNQLFLTFVDYDNDGDYDAVVGEGGYAGYPYASGANELHLFENYGTPENEYLYHTSTRVLPEGENAINPSPAFFDFDNDGDLDLIEGDYDGFIHYYRNDNPAAVITVDETPLEFTEASGSTPVDATLAIDDPDMDEISYATIEITNFHPNDTLTFNPNPPVDESATITYDFNNDDGVLTIRGLASTYYYQEMLQSLVYHFDQPPVGPSSSSMAAEQAGSQKIRAQANGGASILTVNKTIRLSVFDSDRTAGVTAVRAIAIGTGYTPPVINSDTVAVAAGKSIAINLNALISDGQDSDASLSVMIVGMPGSGANASINPTTKILTVDYTGLSFTGQDEIDIRVTDTDGYQATNTLRINVTNIAPEWNPQNETVVAGASVTYDISGFYSDADDNLVASSLNVTAQPGSGAAATLNGTDLTVDYTGMGYVGNDTLELQICDIANACTTQELIIVVTNTDPTFADGTGGSAAGKIATVDLSALFSDADNNLVDSTLSINAAPTSGALASINGSNLEVDYAGLPFTGNDVIEVVVCDIADACATANITIAVMNNNPTFTDGAGAGVAGKTVTVDLAGLFSDLDDNLVASSLNVEADPASGATASINGTDLEVDYAGLSFTGDDIIQVEICDIANACATADITINITNTAPVLSNGDGTSVAGGNTSVNLLPLLSDADDNLALSTLKVVGVSTSGVVPTIDGSHNLNVNYTGITFSGNDQYTIEACDIAGECAQSVVTIDVTNNDPSLATESETITYGGVASISLLPLIIDSDNNINMASLRVVAQPASGADAAIDSNHNLIVDYAGVVFASSENVQVEVCDYGGACAQATYIITVNNSAPVLQFEQVNAGLGNNVTVDLLQFASDFDDNLDVQTFEVVGTAKSGADVQIVDGQLVVDYSKVTFNGIDEITIRVCDAAGACTESMILIRKTVHSEITVNNAVAPNGSSEANRYLHVNGLAEQNTVSIYNRWGDKVWERSGYNNETVRFEGKNDNGNDLSSGTYYYKVESIFFDGETTFRDTKEGYLALKQ